MLADALAELIGFVLLVIVAPAACLIVWHYLIDHGAWWL
jgi:hypothetical protein